MDKRLALVIANSDFDDPKLRHLDTSIRDAKVLADVLNDPAIGNFNVKLLVDEREVIVRREIGRFYASRSRSDLLFLYYSGHGIRDEYGDLYLATQDTEMDLVGATALDTAYVRTQIDKSASRRKVVVLDCCHSGAFAKAGMGDSVGTEDAFAGSGYGRVILTASDALELSWEGDEWLGKGKPSVFTYYLVQGLRTGAADLNSDGKISLDELYDYVYEQVLSSGYAKQTPHKWAQKVQGQIIVAQNASSALKLTSLPSDLQQAINSSVSWMREGAVSGLGRLMVNQEEGIAQAARAALEELTYDENPSVSTAAARALGVEKFGKELKPISSHSDVKEPGKAHTFMIVSPIHLDLVRVPAGDFVMGSDPTQDKDSFKREQPQHTVDLPEFAIGKHPITNAQYSVFVQTTNHRRPKHWKEDGISSNQEDLPVVCVACNDVAAFCEWLSWETGRSFRLPSEAEWEKAARETDGRIYPWGDDPPTSELCNFDENIGSTTPVGSYSPQGDSPYGCTDMAGNVWEWTRTLWRNSRNASAFEYPYDARDGREDPIADNEMRRVVRGGAFNFAARFVRCASRSVYYPNSRLNYVGFRVVAFHI
jgi:formylglycine-generating enzyme required for sulfatase activity